MKLWVDADACPQAIKTLLFRSSERLQVPLHLVANSPMRIPNNPLVEFTLVKAGADVADQYIADHVASGDVVVTGDIPLAAQVVERGGICIEPRGELLDAENVKGKLSMRNFMEEMRFAGMVQGGPSAPTSMDHQKFANTLDRLLTRRLKERDE
ncbi:MAG: YaiI/YqxD family protein [Planctomycetota bacterium]